MTLTNGKEEGEEEKEEVEERKRISKNKCDLGK
jgi:hypothetical protein